MAAVIAGNSGMARWVREENLHLTVAFLGRIDEELLPMIDASLAPLVVLAVAFSLAYERTGHIGTAIVAHALFNLNTVILIFCE